MAQLYGYRRRRMCRFAHSPGTGGELSGPRINSHLPPAPTFGLIDRKRENDVAAGGSAADGVPGTDKYHPARNGRAGHADRTAMCGDLVYRLKFLIRIEIPNLFSVGG